MVVECLSEICAHLTLLSLVNYMCTVDEPPIDDDAVLASGQPPFSSSVVDLDDLSPLGHGAEDLEEEVAPTEEEEEKENSSVVEASGSGHTVGIALSLVRDSTVNGTARYDTKVNGDELVYLEVVNNQDNISGKSKKFFELVPNSTPQLYAFRHYHALLNTRSNRGWLAHCRLKTEQPGAEGDGFILWEIWETRCDKPRIDGIVFRLDCYCVRIQNLEKWLVDNNLSSDPAADFDVDFHTQ